MNTPRPILPLVKLALVACALSGVGGCGYSRHSALTHTLDSPHTPSPAPVWPRNYTQDLPTLRASLYHEYTPEAPKAPPTAEGRPPGSLVFGVVDVGEPLGQGWVTYSLLTPLDPPPPGGAPALMTTEGFSSASISYAAWRERPQVLDTILAKPADRPAEEVRADIGLLTASAPFRMRFYLTRPRSPSRGVVLYQWGLSGQRFEESLVKALADDGWTVLAHGGLSWRRPGALTVTPERGSAAARISAAAFATDRPVGSKPVPATAEEQALWAETAARLAAADFDDALGQYALATQAAYEYVRRHHPQLVGERLVLVGSSFGAIMSPTLAALIGERLDAAVLIGGGANFLEIAGDEWMDYYYSRVRGYSSINLRVPARLRAQVAGHYLNHSTLDPYHTAVHLRGVPTLMLHASWDRIVPWRTGDVLWERAGRPERWVGAFGHLWMFLTLSRRADDIASWIDAACPRGSPAASGVPRAPDGSLARYDLPP